ncbi:MAG: hypothetical protein Q9168_007819, partial [Polycauliona sp. 1 TL-2023]
MAEPHGGPVCQREILLWPTQANNPPSPASPHLPEPPRQDAQDDAHDQEDSDEEYFDVEDFEDEVSNSTGSDDDPEDEDPDQNIQAELQLLISTLWEQMLLSIQLHNLDELSPLGLNQRSISGDSRYCVPASFVLGG